MLKAKIHEHILKIAERIYAPGGTDCLAAAKEWELYIGSSVEKSVHIKSNTGGSNACEVNSAGSFVTKSVGVEIKKK